jgi:hypothetical protein
MPFRFADGHAKIGGALTIKGGKVRKWSLRVPLISDGAVLGTGSSGSSRVFEIHRDTSKADFRRLVSL